MPNLILIRHSISQPDRTLPASEWRLTPEGRERCRPLARALARWEPVRLISSLEPKALETAQLTAVELGIPCEIAAGLHEHDRSNVPLLGSQEAFVEQVSAMFAQPDELVFGMESAKQAGERFTAAVEHLLEQFPEETLGIVSHGTVISLLSGNVLDDDAQAIWSKLGMPAYLVFSLPDFELLEFAEEVSE